MCVNKILKRKENILRKINIEIIGKEKKKKEKKKKKKMVDGGEGFEKVEFWKAKMN